MNNVKILAGIVLYNPDATRLQENINAIASQVDKVVLIENGSSDLEYTKMIDVSQSVYIRNYHNKGIAYALNQILQYAEDNRYEWALTLDQDSVVDANTIPKYSEYCSIPNVGLITCRIIDRNFGEREKNNLNGKYEFVDFCIQSASLLNVNVWRKVGGFCEEMFIDSVDLDMCLLVKEHGYKILRVNDVQLFHELGHSRIVKLFGKNEVALNHAPIRYYYIIRNYLLLGQRHKKRLQYMWHALKRLLIVNIYETGRREKNAMMFKGFCHGIQGKYGAFK